MVKKFHNRLIVIIIIHNFFSANLSLKVIFYMHSVIRSICSQ